jgi:hypothetical protein
MQELGQSWPSEFFTLKLPYWQPPRSAFRLRLSIADLDEGSMNSKSNARPSRLAPVETLFKWRLPNCEEKRIRRGLFAVGRRYRFDSLQRTRQLQASKSALHARL